MNPSEGLTKTGDCFTTKILSTGEKVHLWGIKKAKENGEYKGRPEKIA
ncbi:hypothetical protein MKZ42_03180 [Pseudoalteromonas shioyasakiensis]|uniref:Uncharacterized protein n=1 Tax=Pseudoalteromonas shioyasakiensis TaxID=1190813 RepID=A0ABT6U4P8_9GAMM|nr:MULTISPECIES: hypothetical protein [Pseudoalteromonas]MDI4670990.1 hypothetical protein [Pseudoalteromonas shioyasakiensis]MDI4672265.1 hypothetical protein [Pseudoalteromonas shioyasakiensis]MDI4687899.1 hypothetical protein [Pseudoalteromonas shioyasakiensis]MDI4706495.1 hypothetical protein [Pseudoalteromonas shioyasakiensis]NUJ23247.1 hypothetical protein [Pseudoalteromonas sp. 0802]